MMKSPNPVKNPEPRSNRNLRFLLLNRNTIALGIVTLLISLGGGAWWLWIFVYKELAPLIEKNLAQTLNRPVHLGRVQTFSFTSLQFGQSSVPATATDPDRVAVDAVDVAFDPVQLLFTRTLKLDVTLVNPNIYIQQDAQGRWVSSTVKAEDKAGVIKTDLDTIRFRNADVVLVPNAEARGTAPKNISLVIAQVNGVTQFLEDNQLIQFELGGQMARGGTLALQGQYRPSTEQTNLQIQTQNLLASDVTRLIPLPLDLQAGRVDGNLKVQLRKEQQAELFGTAVLKAVRAQINQLPQPFINSQGTLRFKGTLIGLDNVSTSYGKIGTIANGVINTEAGYNLFARVPAVSVANAQQTLNIELPVAASGVVQANVKLTGPISKPILLGTVATIKPARIDKVNFSNIRTRFAFSSADSVVAFKDILATPTVGGKVTGAGIIQLGQKAGIGFDLAAQNIPGDAIARLYNVSPQIKIGVVSAKTQISGTPAKPETIVNWQATQATYPGTGQIRIVDKNTIIFRNTVFNVAGGTVRAAGQLVNNRWQALVQANNVQLGRLTQVSPALQAPLSGTFKLSGTTASFQPEAIRATGTGQIQVAGGTVTASNIQLAAGRWQAQLRATSVQLGRLAQVPPALQGALTGRFNLSGTTASFQPETLRGSGQGRLNVAGGTVTATNIQLARGQWQALVNASQVQLKQFSQELRGLFSGQLRLAGMLDSAKLSDIRGAGRVRFSQGVGLIQQPLTALVGWDGKKIIVQQATAPNLKASGLIFAKVEGAGAPEITGLNLNVQAQNYNLQDLPFALPNTVTLAGKGDFAGRLFGTLPTPNVVGSVRLRSLAVNNLAFEPVLTGDVQVVPGRGVELELTGTQDRIAFNLDPNYRPTSFLIQQDQALAIGQSQGENLLVNVENFPLAALNLSSPNPAFGPGPVAGLLTGDFQINQARSIFVGDVAIAQPAIGRIKGDRFVGQLRYANGVTTLTNSEFTLNESRYALAGSFTQTRKGPEFQGQVNITQGQIQDVLTALQFFDLQDFSRGLQPPTYARANQLKTVPVGIPEASLLTQLRRFSEIEALLQQQRQQRRDTLSLPPLADLEGTFNGEISVDGSLQNGIAVNFDLEGKNWEFGSYNADQIIAEGSFENGVLTLLPLRIESEDTLLAFNGQVGGTQQSGQLQVRNFPVDVLDNFVRLPNDAELTGKLNATATLAGSVANPQAVGELQLTDGTLNQKQVESATASFSYANARLNFGSNVVVSGPEPVEITGSIPVQLPFAAIAPDSDQIRLDVDVQNEGLALLNLFTDQAAWKDGQGQVQLQVRGTTQQPVATGIATVNNATITAEALPEPLTDVTGTLRFNFDRILVEGLQGKFSDGQVVAQGVIPIFKTLQPDDPDFTNPLTVSLDQLALNLQGLYQGGASGNVLITGTALSPVIGGEVRLAEGEVLLADANATTPTSSGSTSGAIGAPSQIGEGAGANADAGTVPEFNNLRLTLGDDIAIIRPPILNFQATGTLILNGTRNDIRPAGTISLRRGSVNLFTTQFVLARGYEHTATFSPNQALDPTLDIRLIAAVPEVTQRRVPSSSVSSEVAETFSTNVGGLETIRVQARVTGPASQLFDNLQLTSDPSRSQSEIIALIGGGFVDTLGRGDSALGFANFASSALLGNFQGTITNIGNAIGLSELRIFPTVTTEERSRDSTLALAAEAGIDISRNIYFSLLRVLTDEEPTRFGLVYRLNDNVRVRTSTDLSGDSSAVVEYENRF
jgi:translocation and assembly module TamB